MSLALIFAGQGAQKVGMGKSLYEGSVAAKALYDAEIDKERAIYSDAKRDYKFTKKEIQGYYEDATAVRRDVETAEQRRYRIRLRMGLPVGRTGEQQELEERLPETESRSNSRRNATRAWATTTV